MVVTGKGSAIGEIPKKKSDISVKRRDVRKGVKLTK